MNMNILPVAVTTAKGVTSSKAAGGTSLLNDVEANAAPQDFASQLDAQLGSKLGSQLNQLGQQLTAKGQVIDKNTLTQAINAGEKDGSLSLDDTQLSQIMSAIQNLPNGDLQTASAATLKNAALSGQDDVKEAKADDASALPVQALFAMLAAQPSQNPATASPLTSASAQSALTGKTDDSKDKNALLHALSGDAKNRLAQESDKSDGGKTRVTDTNGKVASKGTDVLNSKSAKSTDFNTALASLSTVSAAAAQQANSKNGDNGALLQNANSLNSAALAVSSAPVSTTPTTTTLVSAPTVPQLNAQLGSPEWQQQLGQQVMMFNRQGQQTAELRLHPQDLGSIQISMKIEDGQAQMQFVSGHSGVRAALEAAMPQLRTSLADSGITLNQTNVSSDTSQWQQASNGAQQQFNQQSGSSQGNAASWAAFNAGATASASDALPVPASLQLLANGKSGVDIFA